MRALLAAAAIIFAASARADDPGNHYPFAAGTIKSVDASGKLLTITTPAGTQTLGVTERTYLFRGKEKLTADKLKVGEVVKINYYTNETGQAFIRRLKVALPPSP
jgi:Cu/Ag efflux protein CusF